MTTFPSTDSMNETVTDRATLLPCDCLLVAVSVTDDESHLVAATTIAKGTHLFKLNGVETTTPTRFSVQLTHTSHLAPAPDATEAEIVARYGWRFMNHSCDPTTMIQNREVIAIRDMQPGDAVTFDYNTTEYDMAEPFDCGCGTDACIGLVRGARHLTAEQRTRLGVRLAEYLR